MIIQLTDEQYNQLLEGAEKTHDGTLVGELEIQHEKSGFQLYAEMHLNDGKTIITYTEANSGSNCFWGDKETIDRFIQWGKRTLLTDEHNSCPNCYTPMIYRFNHCPKCGQILKWE